MTKTKQQSYWMKLLYTTIYMYVGVLGTFSWFQGIVDGKHPHQIFLMSGSNDDIFLFHEFIEGSIVLLIFAAPLAFIFSFIPNRVLIPLAVFFGILILIAIVVLYIFPSNGITVGF